MNKSYQQELFNYSINIEKKQTNYKKNLLPQKNINTGEVFKITSDYDSTHKTYVKTIEQKVNALVALANYAGLIALFLTLTLPTKYHPYKTLKNGKKIKNKNYKYENLEDAITEGYQ